jgi:hypothetical protein
MSKQVLETESCYEMDFTQRCGDKVDVSKDQKVSIMVKKVKVPVGGENKALNCTHCKVTCQYPGNSNISTETSCPSFEMEDVGAAALDSDFVSVSWACKVCPGHCLGGVHQYEDFKWYFTQETTNSMEDQQLDEEGITKNWKKKIEKTLEEITQRLDVLEMKAPALDPSTTRPENVQEMITPEEDNKKPAGEDEKFTANDNQSTEK